MSRSSSSSSTDSQDRDFGQPKPEFRNAPFAHPRRVATTVSLALLLLAAGVAKLVWDRRAAPTQASQACTASALPAEQAPGSTSEAEEGGRATNVEVNESVSREECFERKIPAAETEKNIGLVKKRLAEVERKPTLFVRPGTYRELYAPQGIYHIVVASHLKRAGAMRSVQQLTQKKWGVCVIVPSKGQRYYRVTIAHSKTRQEAERRLKKVKETYKSGFVLNY